MSTVEEGVGKGVREWFHGYIVSNGPFLGHEAVTSPVVEECSDGGMFNLNAIQELSS